MLSRVMERNVIARLSMKLAEGLFLGFLGFLAFVLHRIMVSNTSPIVPASSFFNEFRVIGISSI